MAPSLAGRVELHAAHYTHAHDGDGRDWITVDKREVVNFCDHIERREWDRVAEAVLAEHAEAWQDATPNQRAGWRNWETERRLRAAGILSSWRCNNALYEYLSLSIDDALASDNAVIRALAMTDRRLGKRRLRTLRVDDSEYPFIQRLHRLRCEAEGVRDLPAASSPQADGAFADVRDGG